MRRPSWTPGSHEHHSSDAATGLDLYSRTAELASNQVISAYSTSFGLATRLLGRRHRQHVRNIYALVRVADELVDGVGSEAGLTREQQFTALDRLLSETLDAVSSGFSSNLVVHAFARTARTAGIDAELINPFFDSMRTDLLLAGGDEPARFDPEAHTQYVYGSAEVVGLMCLRVFVRDDSLDADTHERLTFGARQLGAAFQDVNFLRDLADDTQRLGRSYLGTDDTLSAQSRDTWIATIRGQLSDAEAVIPLLPTDAQAAVRTAASLFRELADRIAETPIEVLQTTRVRVPDSTKALLLGRALTQTWREPHS